MKHKMILPAVASAALILLTTSCETLEKVGINIPIPIPTFNREAKPAETKNPRDVLPQDREQFILDKAAKTYTSSQIRSGVVVGDWAIEKVNGREIEPGEQAPYLKFDKSSMKFYGNNGCNFISGDYTFDRAAKTLKIETKLSTMMLCPDADLEAEINSALARVERYDWTSDDNSFHLFLLDEQGNTVISLMHQDFAFLDGTWTVKALNDEPIDTQGRLKFVIDVADGIIHGNTGCNVLNGRIVTDMDAPNSISFQQISTQGKSCPDVTYENEFIVALEDASTAKPISANKVLLINNHGIVVLELERYKE